MPLSDLDAMNSSVKYWGAMSGEKKFSIFADANMKRLARNKESDQFIKYARRAIGRALDETHGFAEFNEAVSHRIDTDPKLPGWLQVSFGSRLLFRPDPQGKAAYEAGPSLVYSRGPTGEMTVIMFPIKSEVASVTEDTIILRIGYFDFWELYLGVRQDMSDLVSYAYVSSIDLNPTLGQRMRIGWLRFASRQHIDGRHQYSPLRTSIRSLLKLALAGSFQGLFRFAAPLTIGWFVGRYGIDWLTGWFR
jgi:hypothetical protein